MAHQRVRDNIVVAGWPFLDVVVKAPPQPGNPGLRMADFHRSPGGSATIVATDLHRMGLNARLVGVIGDDDAGMIVARALHEEKLETRFVKRGYTPDVLCVVTPEGEMRFHNQIETVSVEMSDLDESWIDAGTRALHFEGWQLNDAATRETWRELARRAHAVGAMVTLDLPGASYMHRMGVANVNQAVKQIGVDVLFASHVDAEAADLPNSASFWAPTVIVHAGHGATNVVHNGELRRYPVHGIPLPTDTTGAGDAFAAGFIATRVVGGSLDDAIWAAHSAGRTAVQYVGAALPQGAARSLWESLSTRSLGDDDGFPFGIGDAGGVPA